MDDDGHPSPGSGRPLPDGAAPIAVHAGRKRKATVEPQRTDGDAGAHSQAASAASSSVAAASPDDSAAALNDIADGGGSLSLARSVTAASYSPQQVEQSPSAPVPLSVCVTGIDPPSASARLADAAADSATAVSAASANSAAAVPMFRCMNECRDVQFALMQLLTLKDLAALNATCHSWRRWLLHPPLISGLQFELTKGAEPVTLVAQSGWARQLVTSVRLEIWSRGRHTHSLLGRTAPAESELAACNQLLTALPQFTRLHSLSLQMCDAFPVRSLWPTCLTALSASLRTLYLNGVASDPINSFLAHVGILRRLATLTVFLDDGRAARDMNLDPLPTMPCLRKLELAALDGEGERLWFRCFPQRVQHLAQCSQLTYVDCGVWSPDEREFNDQGRYLPPAAQQIDRGIATLVRGLTLQPAGAAAAGASSSSVAPVTSTTAPCRLQILKLAGTDMSAAVWEHVSRLTELRELEPDCWCSDMTPQQWARLARFRQLQLIRVESHPDDEYSSMPLRTKHFLPHLLQCTQLHTVSIVGPALSLSVDQLDAIARLPLLRFLLLNSVEVESVAPLAHATKLRRLLLVFCRGPPAVVDFRRSLPPLPALTELRLDDRCRITAAQAAPLNAALFARMPKLTPAEFKQNLLD